MTAAVLLDAAPVAGDVEPRDHPDDLAARLALRDRLRAVREQERGWPRSVVAWHLGIAVGTLAQAEGWRTGVGALSTVAVWANTLGLSFTVEAQGVPGYADNPVAAALEATWPDDAHQHVAECDRLIEARKTLRLSLETMGRHMGVAAYAVTKLEARETGDTRVASWQRYARALGRAGHSTEARLELVLTDGFTGARWVA